jgi:hypothetical protein
MRGRLDPHASSEVPVARKTGVMIAFSAALDNRRDINLAVFSRTAVRSASRSALAAAPSRAFCSTFLKLASARARTLSLLLVNRLSFSRFQEVELDTIHTWCFISSKTRGWPVSPNDSGASFMQQSPLRPNSWTSNLRLRDAVSRPRDRSRSRGKSRHHRVAARSAADRSFGRTNSPASSGSAPRRSTVHLPSARSGLS